MATQAGKGDSTKQGREQTVIVTPSAVVIPLDENLQRQARECLAKSGRATFSFREVSVTDLTEISKQAGDPVVVD